MGNKIKEFIKQYIIENGLILALILFCIAKEVQKLLRIKTRLEFSLYFSEKNDMSIKNKINGWVALAGLLVAAMIASSGAYASIFPSIPDPGYPFFTNSFKLNANAGNWNVSGGGEFSFTPGMGETPYFGTQSTFRLSAKFNKNTGDFQSGTLSIKGALPGLNIDNKNTLLFSATLTGFGFDGNYLGSGDSLAGFSTSNLDGLICDLFGCTAAESVFLQFNGLLGSITGHERITGVATTTIPLPAAVWLLGSGLLAMGTISRRRKMIAA